MRRSLIIAAPAFESFAVYCKKKDKQAPTISVQNVAGTNKINITGNLEPAGTNTYNGISTTFITCFA